MFKLDNAFLEELGLGSLPAVEKNKMLAHIYETLEMRVGMRLAEQMSNEQLDEFESYINKQDESGALKWLESNFPDYKKVVAQELEKLKAEISQVSPQIVAQSQAALAQQPQIPQQPQAPPQPQIAQQQPINYQQSVQQPPIQAPQVQQQIPQQPAQPQQAPQPQPVQQPTPHQNTILTQQPEQMPIQQQSAPAQPYQPYQPPANQ